MARGTVWDMSGSYVRQREGRPRRAGGLAFGPVAAKLLLRHRPALGTLTGGAQALHARLAKERDSSASGASALTAAELRLLPLLSTHLSYPEIGQELFLSPNTVKSQAVSIYRKLGASSRSQAVVRSRELGLLDQLTNGFPPSRG